jgi:DnaJ-class molecular chaperone
MEASADNARSTCTACRGTGTVISGLGGTQHEITCPWCEGTGRFEPGRDAQHAVRDAQHAGRDVQ